jgi:hypothetical protein
VRRGLASRLNQIAAIARSEYLARMDADDLMHPERLAKQVNALVRRKPAQLAASAVYLLDEQDRPSGLWGHTTLDLRLNAVLRRSPFVHPTVIGRTEWFRANRYDPAYPRAEDHELWCRTCEGLEAVHVPQPLLFYRPPSNSAFAKFRDTYATERRILRTYGAHVDRFFRTRFNTESYFKTWVRACSSAVGLPLPWLGGRSLTVHERHAASCTLRTVLATPVPGLS